MPSELDRRYLSAMPSAEGDIVIIDIPVATLDFAKQSALRTFGGAEDGIRPDIIGQYREQQSILAVTAQPFTAL